MNLDTPCVCVCGKISKLLKCTDQMNATEERQKSE